MRSRSPSIVSLGLSAWVGASWGCGAGPEPTAAASSHTISVPAPPSASQAGSPLVSARVAAVPGPLTGTLDLRITVAPEGITVSGFGGTLAPDCRSHAPGVTFPRAADSSLDLEALTRCARELKSQKPDDTQAVVTAQRSTVYREIVAVFEAVRADASGDMFPEFTLGVEGAASAATAAPAPKPRASVSSRP